MGTAAVPADGEEAQPAVVASIEPVVDVSTYSLMVFPSFGRARLPTLQTDLCNILYPFLNGYFLIAITGKYPLSTHESPAFRAWYPQRLSFRPPARPNRLFCYIVQISIVPPAFLPCEAFVAGHIYLNAGQTQDVFADSVLSVGESGREAMTAAWYVEEGGLRCLCCENR